MGSTRAHTYEAIDRLVEAPVLYEITGRGQESDLDGDRLVEETQNGSLAKLCHDPTMAEKSFTGPIVDVTYDGAICSHAGECVKGMPTVFNLEERPWINPGNATTPEAADLLREVVARCPSGALQIVEH